ncbi:hypothetical protein DFH09DRAFT_1351567 [Mycena vulgaris]|nr:hypothetical protein DFH09DRAFT_1351567 [Mycena vulgaris]
MACTQASWQIMTWRFLLPGRVDGLSRQRSALSPRAEDAGAGGQDTGGRLRRVAVARRTMTILRSSPEEGATAGGAAWGGLVQACATPGTVAARLVGICVSAPLDAYKGLHEDSSARAWDRLIRASHPSTGASPHTTDDRVSSARRGTATTLTTRERIASWSGRRAEPHFLIAYILLRCIRRSICARRATFSSTLRFFLLPRCVPADGVRERLFNATSARIPYVFILFVLCPFRLTSFHVTPSAHHSLYAYSPSILVPLATY